MNRRSPNFIPKTFFDTVQPTQQKLTEVSGGIQLFRNLFHREGYTYDYVFDWTVQIQEQRAKSMGTAHEEGACA